MGQYEISEGFMRKNLGKITMTNWSLQDGKFPEQWKIDIVEHLYKGKGKD